MISFILGAMQLFAGAVLVGGAVLLGLALVRPPK